MRLFFLLAIHVPLAAQTVSQDRLREGITYLTSAELDGRMSLSPGDGLAINWLASEFRKAGLTPAYGDSYLQEVPLIGIRPDREATSLEVETRGQKKRHAVTVS